MQNDWGSLIFFLSVGFQSESSPPRAEPFPRNLWVLRDSLQLCVASSTWKKQKKQENLKTHIKNASMNVFIA